MLYFFVLSRTIELNVLFGCAEIISTADRTDIAPHVKDGYLMMFIYMPAVFGAQFTPYIGQIIVPILKVRIFSYVRKESVECVLSG